MHIAGLIGPIPSEFEQTILIPDKLTGTESFRTAPNAQLTGADLQFLFSGDVHFRNPAAA